MRLRRAHALLLQMIWVLRVNGPHTPEQLLDRLGYGEPWRDQLTPGEIKVSRDAVEALRSHEWIVELPDGRLAYRRPALPAWLASSIDDARVPDYVPAAWTAGTATAP